MHPNLAVLHSAFEHSPRGARLNELAEDVTAIFGSPYAPEEVCLLIANLKERGLLTQEGPRYQITDRGADLIGEEVLHAPQYAVA